MSHSTNTPATTTPAASNLMAASSEASGTPSVWSQRFDRLEGWLATASDYLNPLLVKETRQAMKSRHFALTFVLLLLCCWIITIGGVAIIGPSIYYTAAGSALLTAYYMVLIFPLVVVVPFSAFRSLSAERDENTYDLLRVSSLTPRQIITGKLASSIVQMGVYFSAVAPCLAFTYLLRGIDILTIALFLSFAVLACMGLSMLGLLAAATTQKNRGQIFLSVGFIALLLWCFSIGCAATTEFISQSVFWTNDDEAWIVLTFILAFYVTTFLLCYLAAIALISFRTENRSTPLRWAMLLQQAVFIACLAYISAIAGVQSAEFMIFVPIIGFFIAAGYWYIMGTFLTGESKDLSHRVRRNLPQSMLGRMMLGWFAPGPGTGFFFVLANLTSLGLIAGMTISVSVSAYTLPTSFFFGRIDLYSVWLLLLAVLAYVTIYLGIGRLFIAAVRRLAPVTMVASLLLHLLLLVAGSGIPYAIQMSLRSMRHIDYNPLQWPNPFWSITERVEAAFGGGTLLSPLQLPVLFGVACCVLALNLRSVAREISQGRVALPARIVLDEAELHPTVVRAQSPWEEDAIASPSPIESTP